MRQKTNHKSWEDPHLAICSKCIDYRFFFCRSESVAAVAGENWNEVLFDLRSCPLTLSRLLKKNQFKPTKSGKIVGENKQITKTTDKTDRS